MSATKQVLPHKLTRLAVITSFFLLNSCAAIHRSALRKTEIFYRAQTLETIPEKSPEFAVRVLNAKPPGAKVLGTFEFTTDRSNSFALESAQHNARKHGADAVWVRSLRQWAEPYTQYIPGQTTFIPSTQWISGSAWRPNPGGGGRFYRAGGVVQTFGLYYSPPQTISGWARFSSIDAVMLKLPSQPDR